MIIRNMNARDKESKLKLNPRFQKGLEEAKKEIARGEFVTLDQLKRRLRAD